MVLLPILRASMLRHRPAGRLQQVCLELRPPIKDWDPEAEKAARSELYRSGADWENLPPGRPSSAPTTPPLADVLTATGGYAALPLLDRSKKGRGSACPILVRLS